MVSMWFECGLNVVWRWFGGGLEGYRLEGCGLVRRYTAPRVRKLRKQKRYTSTAWNGSLTLLEPHPRIWGDDYMFFCDFLALLG